MSLRATCSQCQKVLEVRDELAGRKGKCPRCGGLVEIPRLSEPAAEAADEPPAAADAAEGKPAAATEKATDSQSHLPPVKAGPKLPPPRKSAKPPEPPHHAPPPKPAEKPSPSSDSIVIDIKSGGATDRPTSSAGKHASTARKPKTPAVPVWAWIALAFVGGIAATGVTVWAIMRPGDNKTVASSDGADKKTSGKKSPDEDFDAKPEKPRPSGNKPADPGGKTERPTVTNPAGQLTSKSRIARTPNEVKDAIVKFEVPSAEGIGMSSGTGFLLNDKAWVATNHHVINEATSAARAKFANGMVCQIAGIIADDEQHDLAIVKLADPPMQFSVLDINFDADPELDTEVYAFGHPMGEEFALSKGIVSTVLTTADLIRQSGHGHLVEELRAPRHLVWIRHTAKILPGNSGGPLFRKDGSVVGINTFINTRSEYGYASHVRYLRDMLKAAGDQAKPLPDRIANVKVEERSPPFPIGKLTITVDRMRELYEAAEKGGFKPADASQYEPLAELAKMMAFARYAKVPGKEPKPSADEAKQRATLAEELFDKLRGVPYEKEHVKAINRWAAEGVGKRLGGLVLIGKIEGAVPGALLLEIETTEKRVVVPTRGDPSQMFGSRVLVVGVVGPTSMKTRDKEGKEAEVPMMFSHHVGELK